MASGDMVWAVPPNPQHSHCLTCAELHRVTLWLLWADVAGERDRESWGNLAKYWLYHGDAASLGVAVEQLAMSKNLRSPQTAMIITKNPFKKRGASASPKYGPDNSYRHLL
eukprot:3444288-Amphidinium_carterae.1